MLAIIPINYGTGIIVTEHKSLKSMDGLVTHYFSKSKYT